VPSNKIKLVIFDLDGVLTETSAYHFEAWRALAKDFNLELEDEFEIHLKGVSRIESLNRILKAHHLEGQFSQEEKNKMLNKKNTHYQQLISHMTRKNLFEGVIELFDFLKEHKVKIALGSASKNAPRLLKSLAIEAYFGYVVNPASLKSKPDPDIFLDAMNHFNLKPNECIGIEDAYAGVSAINQAGMVSIGIGNSSELNHADYCFDSVKAMPKSFIKRLIKGDSS
jgi:beta-phosphoglucomutase